VAAMVWPKAGRRTPSTRASRHLSVTRVSIRNVLTEAFRRVASLTIALATASGAPWAGHVICSYRPGRVVSWPEADRPRLPPIRPVAGRRTRRIQRVSAPAGYRGEATGVCGTSVCRIGRPPLRICLECFIIQPAAIVHSVTSSLPVCLHAMSLPPLKLGTDIDPGGIPRCFHANLPVAVPRPDVSGRYSFTPLLPIRTCRRCPAPMTGAAP
jgi:hypothetical protein